ncbi:hypothetical protein Hanom_Chr00s005691g01729811 [Helianthus anomalus]
MFLFCLLMIAEDVEVFFFERQIWITDVPLEYYHVTSGTTRSYSSSLGIMSIHQFKRKPNIYEKNILVGIEPRTFGPKVLTHPEMSLDYKDMDDK